MEHKDQVSFKKEITLIKLRVKAKQLFESKNGLVNTLDADDVKAFCELKNENEPYQPAENFETTVGPDEIIVWRAMVKKKSAEAGYSIGLDIVRMRERNSKFFKRVVQLGNKGAVLAETRPSVTAGETEAYDIWFTITHGKGTPEEETKTYVLDPRLKGTSVAVNYLLHTQGIINNLLIDGLLLRQLNDAIKKLLDNKQGNKG